MRSDEIDRQIELARELRDDVRRAKESMMTIMDAAADIAERDEADDRMAQALILPMMERVWEAYENLVAAEAIADLAEAHVRQQGLD